MKARASASQATCHHLLLVTATLLVSQVSLAQTACNILLGRGKAPAVRSENTKLPPMVATSGDKSKMLISDGGLFVQDLLTGSRSPQMQGQFEGLYLEQITNDGKRLLIGSRSFDLLSAPKLARPMTDAERRSPGARVFNVETGELINYFDAGTASELSPDGKLLAAKNFRESGFRLYDVDSGKLLRKMGGNPGQFSPDGKTLLVEGIFSSTLVDARTGEKVQRFFDRGRVSFGPTGTLWFVNGRNVTERNAVTGEVTFQAELPKGANKYTNVARMNFSNDGKIVAISTELQNRSENERNATLLINRETGKSTVLPFGYGHQTRLSHDGRMIVVLDVTKLAVYDTKTFQELYRFEPQMYFKDMIHGATFTGDNRQLVIRRDSTTMTVDLSR